MTDLFWELPVSAWDGPLRADYMTWGDMEDTDVIKNTIGKVAKYGANVVRESFVGLYNSMLPLAEQPPAGLETVHGLLKRAGEMPEWQSLRQTADGDEMSAAFGAAHFGYELIDRLPEEVKNEMEKEQQAQNNLNDLQEQMNMLQAMASAMQQQGNQQGAQQIGQQMANLQGQIGQAQAQANQAAQAVQAAMNNNAAQIANAMARSANAAGNKTQDAKNAAEELGMGWSLAPGQSAKQKIAGLQELANWMSKSKFLKKILDMLGWAKPMVSDELRKVKRGRESFTHYQTGEFDPETAAPDEFLGLILEDGPLGVDFLARVADDDVLHREYEGEDSAALGPILFVEDRSGSMLCEYLGYAPYHISAAVGLALMMQARRQKRRFVWIPFSGSGQFRVYDPGDDLDIQALMKHIEEGWWGGTEPYAPLIKAIELIKSDPSLRRGDIFLDTDGSFGTPPPEFMSIYQEARETPGLKIVALVIGTHPGAADFCDKVVLVHNLVEEKDKIAEAIGAVL